MITKAQVKHIQSLDDKKYRQEFQSFLIEGDKMILEALESKHNILNIVATESWLNKNFHLISKDIEITEVSNSEMCRVSHLKTPQNVLAILKLPAESNVNFSGISLLLDQIQDPGNMGSIIRIADWFGLDGVLLHGACADPYNPKSVQASMGSILRVCTETIDLSSLVKFEGRILAATLKGQSVKSVPKLMKGILIIGNESKGISEEILAYSNEQISIEKIGQAESLNAAIAAGILCHALL